MKTQITYVGETKGTILAERSTNRGDLDQIVLLDDGMYVLLRSFLAWKESGKCIRERITKRRALRFVSRWKEEKKMEEEQK